MLEQGKIIEQGNRKQLLERKGAYWRARNKINSANTHNELGAQAQDAGVPPAPSHGPMTPRPMVHPQPKSTSLTSKTCFCHYISLLPNISSTIYHHFWSTYDHPRNVWKGASSALCLSKSLTCPPSASNCNAFVAAPVSIREKSVFLTKWFWFHLAEHSREKHLAQRWHCSVGRCGILLPECGLMTTLILSHKVKPKQLCLPAPFHLLRRKLCGTSLKVNSSKAQLASKT